MTEKFFNVIWKQKISLIVYIVWMLIFVGVNRLAFLATLGYIIFLTVSYTEYENAFERIGCTVLSSIWLISTLIAGANFWFVLLQLVGMILLGYLLYRIKIKFNE